MAGVADTGRFSLDRNGFDWARKVYCSKYGYEWCDKEGPHS